MGADYAEYYDREFDNEGSLVICQNHLDIEGPYQTKTDDPIIRLYKFKAIQCMRLKMN